MIARLFLAAVVVVWAAATLDAAEAGDRERAAAALALAAAAKVPPTDAVSTPTASADPIRVAARAALALHCGVCRGDLDAARAEAKRTAKPLLVFVGGCDKHGTAATKAGAVTAAVKEYHGDGRPDTEPRIVVLYPEGPKWYIDATIPKDADSKAIAAAVGAAASKLMGPPEPPKNVAVKLDWYAVIPGGLPGLPTSGNCPGGRCPLVR